MTVACPFCQHTSSLLFRTKDFNRRLSRESFLYYRCRSCGLIFLSPIPSNLGHYYPPDYYPIPSSLAELEPVVEAQRYKLEAVQRFVTGGRLLEIGPSYGDFAHVAKQAGFEVDTIEMDERCCRFLRDVVGVRAIHSDDPTATLATSKMVSAKSYDVIALWQVIEHLSDPLGTLKAAAARLAPSGILIVAAPNPSAFQFRILRRYWPHVDAPRHLVLIPVPLLIRHAQQLGLKAVFTTTADKGTLLANVFGWERSLSNFFTRPRLIARASSVGRRIARLTSPIETRGLRGSTYTIIFQNIQP